MGMRTTAVVLAVQHNKQRLLLSPAAVCSRRCTFIPYDTTFGTPSRFSPLRVRTKPFHCLPDNLILAEQPLPMESEPGLKAFKQYLKGQGQEAAQAPES